VRLDVAADREAVQFALVVADHGSSRRASTSSTRSTHSARKARCASGVPPAAAAGAPAAPSCGATSTEITISSTMTGTSRLQRRHRGGVHGEVLIEHLQRLHRDRVARGVQVGDRPLGRIGVHQVPGEQRLVVVVQQLHVDVPRDDVVVLDGVADPVEHGRADEQPALEHELGILRAHGVLLHEAVLAGLGHLLGGHLDREPADVGEAHVVVAALEPLDLDLEVEGLRRIVVRHQASFCTSSPSCASSMDSIATSLPLALSCGPSTFTGKALCTFQVMTGVCSSLSRLTTRSRRSTVLSLTVDSQLAKSLSPLTTPRLQVRLENLRSPGILIDEYSGKEPSRYSIAWFSCVRPVTSENPTRVPPHCTVKWKTGSGYCAGMAQGSFQDTCILCENFRMMNSAGRTTAMPISTFMRPSRMSWASIVVPR